MAIQAVLTGDIVNSTRLTSAKEKQLLSRIKNLFGSHIVEFYRGDSFQAYVVTATDALKLALLCRTAAISFSKGEKEVLFDIRVSIGVGQVNSPVKTLESARGEAFLLSGRRFDEIAKGPQRLVITSSNALANEGLQVIADYLDAVFELMTGKQAEVIFELLQGQQQQQVAKKLKKTKSTIHQRVSSGRWPEIERLLKQYENIINLLS